jgi:hypothetical protein
MNEIESNERSFYVLYWMACDIILLHRSTVRSLLVPFIPLSHFDHVLSIYLRTLLSYGIRCFVQEEEEEDKGSFKFLAMVYQTILCHILEGSNLHIYI